MNIRDLFSSEGSIRITLNWDKILEESSGGVLLLKGFLVARKDMEEGILDSPIARLLIEEGGLVHGTVTVEGNIVSTLVVRNGIMAQAMLETSMFLAFREYVEEVLEDSEEESSREFIRRVEEYLNEQRGDNGETG
jgi:hypothetical protein